MVGFLVCVSCGDGVGTDLTDRDVFVVDGESWAHYAAFRTERGEAL